MFLVVGHQVCTHLRRDFVPLLFADPLQVIKVSRLTFGNSNLQLSPQIFYGMKVWRLARPLQDLNVLLLEPLLCCLGSVFLGHCHARNTIHDPFSMPWLASIPWPWRYMSMSIVPLMRCSCPVPLAEKHPQSIMFPPPCLTVGMVFLRYRQHSSSSKHGELSWCQRARFWSHLTTTSDLWIIGKLQTVHVLSWAGGPCGCCNEVRSCMEPQ